MWELSWFYKDDVGDDELVGNSYLEGISILDLRNLFDLPSEDPMIGGRILSEQHVEYIQKFTQHQINLEKYDYFIERLQSIGK